MELTIAANKREGRSTSTAYKTKFEESVTAPSPIITSNSFHVFPHALNMYTQCSEERGAEYDQSSRNKRSMETNSDTLPGTEGQSS
ncbi:hypothetical protein LIER_23799 [Lithospermum erythrorhizon]|uniref:Uncharacterized protein n=1 Tax=Lithospermum erythrorhizon TaxID=34254 RepID=A0AAV3R1M3_LITER